ncbi:PH domain-containing protein [Luteimicrobium sp. DT211]|uniref:PH domain-containing protein n=1 Tax=Luteimicrobium sp. DT211 TaxID=3393412 RepID=UPI003CEEE161
MTPLVKGWLVLVVVVVGLLRSTAEQGGGDGARFALRHLAWVVLGVAVIVVVAGTWSWLAWRVTAYAIDPDAVHMRSGVLVKQHRKARLDRIQAIEVRQPLAARIFGLAEVKVEVAGGDGSGVSIGYLTERTAQELRADLLARAAGVGAPSSGGAGPAVAAGTGGAPAPAPQAAPALGTPGADTSAPVAPTPVAPAAAVHALEAPEQPLFEVPSGRLVASTALSVEAWVFVLLVAAAAVAAIAARTPAVLFSFLPVVIGFGSALFGRFNRSFAFRAATSPDGIRLRHGLTETRAQTIPPGRVQAVELVQPFLWRRLGWWRVHVNVAGYGRDANAKAPTTVLLPVGSRAEATTALWLVLPDLGTPDPLALLGEALDGAGPSDAFTVAPRRSRWLDPVGWRRNGYAVTARAVLARSGRVRRRLVVVPHERTQSLGLEQGPLQRRLGLASFVLHSTPGSVHPEVPHLDAHDARVLLDEQSVRAREARSHDLSERWLRRPEQQA